MRPVGNVGGARFAGTAAAGGRRVTVISEAALLAAVLDMARLYRWRSFHPRPARVASGYRTAVSGDGVGFPDLVLVRDRRLIFAELKSPTGELSAEQQAWLLAFQHVEGSERHIWRPADLHSGLIARTLA